MAPQGDQMMRITNISSENLGTERPLSLFLRRKPRNPKDKLAYRSMATVPNSQIPPAVRAWEKQGKVTITPVKDDSPHPGVPKPKKAPEAKEMKTPTSPKTDKDEADKKGDFSNAIITKADVEKAASNTEVTVDEKAKEAEDKGQISTDEAPSAAKVLPPAEKNNAPTVSSGADGSSVVNDAPSKEEEEKVEEEDQAPEADKVYTMDELKGMKVAEIREIVKARNLGVRSTQKAQLIGAILAAQTGDPVEEESEE
jgi:hypothetical protein